MTCFFFPMCCGSSVNWWETVLCSSQAESHWLSQTQSIASEQLTIRKHGLIFRSVSRIVAGTVALPEKGMGLSGLLKFQGCNGFA